MTVWLPQEWIDDLKAAAWRYDITLAEYCQRAVEDLVRTARERQVPAPELDVEIGRFFDGLECKSLCFRIPKDLLDRVDSMAPRARELGLGEWGPPGRRSTVLRAALGRALERDVWT